MATRGRKEKPIDREAGPWHAFIADLRELRGSANLATVGRAMGYSASYLSRSLSPANLDLSEDFVRSYARACGADPDEWARRRAEALRAVREGETSHAEAVRGARPEETPRDELDTTPIMLRSPAQDSGGRTTETLAAKQRLLLLLLRPSGVVALAAVGLAVLIGVVVTTRLTGGDGVSAVTTPEPLTQQCRDGWSAKPEAALYVLPCIERGPAGVVIYVKVKPMPLDGAPDEATVWLWLMHRDPEALKNRTFHLTRNESTLRRCRIRNGDPDQVVTCGPFKLPPPAKEGLYSTATNAHPDDSVYPPGWYDPGVSGTQGGLLPWKRTGSE